MNFSLFKIFILFVLLCFPLSETLILAEEYDSPAAYSNSLKETYSEIRVEMWNYIRTVAHGRNAGKVEKKRLTLLKSFDKSIKKATSFPAYESNTGLRDSVVWFLNSYAKILKEDFDIIVEMEKVSEESFEKMKLYLDTRAETDKKLEEKDKDLTKTYDLFAGKYNLTTKEVKDKLGFKLKISNDVHRYYNPVFLIYFEAFMYEKKVLIAMNEKDTDAMKENSKILSQVATKCLIKLDSIPAYRGDHSLITYCKRLITFYKTEAEDYFPILANFTEAERNYNKMNDLINSKDRMLVSKKENEQYNLAVDTYNSQLNKANSTKTVRKNKRQYVSDNWSNAAKVFLINHIPK